jgi:hypothetical protein
MKFGTWKAKNLYMADSLKILAKRLEKYVTFSGSTRGQMEQGWH